MLLGGIIGKVLEAESSMSRDGGGGGKSKVAVRISDSLDGGDGDCCSVGGAVGLMSG